MIVTGSTPAARRRGALVPVVVIGAVVVATLWWAGTSSRRGGVTGDPASTEPDGARATVLLLEQAGLDVSTGPLPEPGAGTVVVLNQRFTAGLDREVDTFIEEGGVAVVAAGPERAPSNGSAVVDGPVDAACPEPEGFGDVTELRLGTASSLVASDGATSCFVVGDGHLVVLEPEGDGARVSVGSVEPFLNRSIDEADNSVLVVRLAQLGTGPVTVLDRSGAEVAGGTRTLSDLLPPWFWAMVAQGAVAVLAFVLWKGMRFGRPVEEAQPVPIDANALVEATGRLLAHSRRPADAATRLREGFRAELVSRTGLPDDATDDAVVAATGCGPEDRAVVAEAIAAVPADLDRSGLLHRATVIAAARAALLRPGGAGVAHDAGATAGGAGEASRW